MPEGNNILNPDEQLASNWLKSQEHQVSNDDHDPPDFVVDGNIGVEVTRISERFTDELISEEGIRYRLFNNIKKTLEQLNKNATGPLWTVNVEYNFLSATPHASSKEKKAISKELTEALLPYAKSESETGQEYLMLHQRDHFDFDRHHDEMDLITFPHLCLPCGPCLELFNPTFVGQSGFDLNDVSHAKGTGILCELESAVKYALEVKTGKIKNIKDDFAEWWLVLVDHISPVPHSGLSSDEMTELRNSIDVPDPWSRIIVISSKNIQWHYEFKSG